MQAMSSYYTYSLRPSDKLYDFEPYFQALLHNHHTRLDHKTYYSPALVIFNSKHNLS